MYILEEKVNTKERECLFSRPSSSNFRTSYILAKENWNNNITNFFSALKVLNINHQENKFCYSIMFEPYMCVATKAYLVLPYGRESSGKHSVYTHSIVVSKACKDRPAPFVCQLTNSHKTSISSCLALLDFQSINFLYPFLKTSTIYIYTFSVGREIENVYITAQPYYTARRNVDSNRKN